MIYLIMHSALNRGFWWVGAWALFLVSCVGNRTVTFSVLEPSSEINLVPLENPEGLATKLKNPTTVPVSILSKQALRINAAGKAPVYWFMPSEISKKTDIKIRALPACTGGDYNRNRPLRLIMKAYQSLYGKDFNLARELASKAGDIDPGLAAPHIIIGLTYYQQGKKEDARLAFNKAKALDPEDEEITQLLQLVP